MILNENFKCPVGDISMYMYKKGGYIDSEGTLHNSEMINEFHDHNLIVNTASILMCGRMAPGATTGSGTSANTGDFLDKGLAYLAVGTGPLKDPSKPYDKDTNTVDTSDWNILEPTSAKITNTKLTCEGYRKPFTSWCFVDASGAEVTEATNVLKLTTTFNSNEANFPINEMAIFGGSDAKDWMDGAGKDTGYMYNQKTLPVWSKTSDAELTVVWKLTF